MVSHWIIGSSVLLSGSTVAAVKAAGDAGILTGAWDKITGFISAVIQALTWDYAFLKGNDFLTTIRYFCWCLSAGFIVSLIYIVMSARQILKL